MSVVLNKKYRNRTCRYLDILALLKCVKRDADNWFSSAGYEINILYYKFKFLIKFIAIASKKGAVSKDISSLNKTQLPFQMNCISLCKFFFSETKLVAFI